MRDVVLNLTQHAAKPEQVAAGVRDLVGEDLAQLRDALTVPASELLSGGVVDYVHARARTIRDIALRHDARVVMVGGLPVLTQVLVGVLRRAGIRALYSVSDRVSEDRPDGTKVSVHKHVGFVWAGIGMSLFDE